MVMAGKPIIGLAGGIGSGKSAVAGILGDLGAGVISSDRLNREELDTPEVLAHLSDWWGKSIIGPDGRANREAIRRIIRADAAERERLERLLHPRIAERRNALTAAYQADPTVRAVVWDSPLLFEAGLAPHCNVIVFVESDAQTRWERVKRERGWARDELERFEELQKPLDYKRTHADYIIVNNSDLDALRRRTEDVFSRILSDS